MCTCAGVHAGARRHPHLRPRPRPGLIIAAVAIAAAAPAPPPPRPQPPPLPPHACTPPPVRASIPAPQLWLQQQLHPQQPRLLQGRGRRRRQRLWLCCGCNGVGRSCGKIWYSGAGVSSCSNNGRNISASVSCNNDGRNSRNISCSNNGCSVGCMVASHNQRHGQQRPLLVVPHRHGQPHRHGLAIAPAAIEAMRLSRNVTRGRKFCLFRLRLPDCGLPVRTKESFCGSACRTLCLFTRGNFISNFRKIPPHPLFFTLGVIICFGALGNSGFSVFPVVCRVFPLDWLICVMCLVK